MFTAACGAAAAEPISIDDYPPPPEEFAALIRDGKVSFETGSRDLPADSPRQRLDAETRFDLKFDYRVRHTWRWDAAGKTMTVQLRYSHVQVGLSHTVWLREPPAPDGFWDAPLVRHEFDHVRISTDPTLLRRFPQLLRERSRITVTPAGGRSSLSRTAQQRLANRLAQQRAEQVFAELQSLIVIRYAELDRVTSHGQRPVPEKSAVRRWLDESAAAQRSDSNGDSLAP